jgi:histidinol phosphatase-like enzyme
MINVDYNKEKELLRQKVQQENYIRIQRMREYRRQTILNKHLTLQERLNQKKRNIHLVQDCAINKNLSEQEASKLVTKLLDRMKTSNPNDQDQRECLMKTMSDLNTKYNLGLTFNYKNLKYITKQKQTTDK